MDTVDILPQLRAPAAKGRACRMLLPAMTPTFLTVTNSIFHLKSIPRCADSSCRMP